MPPTLLLKGALEHPNVPDQVPIDYIYNFIKNKLSAPLDASNPYKSRVLILEAKTASGKSITVPPIMTAILADIGGDYKNKKVICTQPRVITAMSIPRELDGVQWFTKYNGLVLKLDDNMAYHTGPFQTDMSNSVKLIYSSNGVLDTQLTKNPPEYIFKRYGCIIIDEAHDRNMLFDRTLMMIKNIFMNNLTNPALPFIICMSATFDYERYAAFFNCDMDNVIRVSGQSYPIDDRWATSDVAEYIPEAVKKCRECIDEELSLEISKASSLSINPPVVESDNRILLFLPGAAETKRFIKGLKKLEPEISTLIGGSVDDDIEIISYMYKYSDKLIEMVVEILPFDSQAVGRSSKAYMRISGSEERTKSNMRFLTQVLITGAVAETGLSLPDLKYVIDAGWNKTATFNPRVNIKQIVIISPGAQSQLTQRRGRVGRKKPGVRIALYTEETFKALSLLQEPDIIRDDPTMMLLAYTALYGRLEVGDYKPPPGGSMSERLLDAPSNAACESSLRKMQMLGFIDNDGEITDTGRIASKISSLDVQQIGMIMAGMSWDVSLDDLVAIAVITPALSGVGAIWGYNQIEQEALLKIVNNKANKRASFAAKDELRIRDPKLEHWNEILTTVFPDDPKPGDLYYKYRLICCDQFIDGLIVYRAFQIKFTQYKLMAVKTGADNAWIVTEMIKWTSAAFINYNKFVKLVETYIRTLDDLVTAGINVYKNKDHSLTRLSLGPGPPFMDTLTRIKKCIHHGYKANIATLDNTGMYRVWFSKLDEKIELEKKYKDAKFNPGYKLPFTWSLFDDKVINWKKMKAAYEYAPKTIVFRLLEVSEYDPKEKSYPVKVLTVSVVSGF